MENLFRVTLSDGDVFKIKADEVRVMEDGTVCLIENHNTVCAFPPKTMVIKESLIVND